jgi:hypothetical protein
MATLNGWQRTGVVVAVFWTVVVLSISYGNWPSPSGSVRELEAGEAAMLTSDAERGFIEGLVPDEKVGPLVSPDSRWKKPEGDPRTYVRTKDGWHLKQSTEEVLGRRYRLLEKLDTERQALRDRRVEHVRVTLMVWAIPLVFLCAIGWSAVWIRRGFQGRQVA